MEVEPNGGSKRWEYPQEREDGIIIKNTANMYSYSRITTIPCRLCLQLWLDYLDFATLGKKQSLDLSSFEPVFVQGLAQMLSFHARLRFVPSLVFSYQPVKSTKCLCSVNHFAFCTLSHKSFWGVLLQQFVILQNTSTYLTTTQPTFRNDPKSWTILFRKIIVVYRTNGQT